MQNCRPSVSKIQGNARDLDELRSRWGPYPHPWENINLQWGTHPHLHETEGSRWGSYPHPQKHVNSTLMVWLTILVDAAVDIVTWIGDLDTIDMTDSVVVVSVVVVIAAALVLAVGILVVVAIVTVTKARR